jgi:hypothetical protein
MQMAGNFEFLNEAKVPEDVVDYFKLAESKAKTQPNTSVDLLRKSLEKWLKWLCEQHRIQFPIGTRPTIQNRIHACSQLNLFTSAQKSVLHSTRQETNSSVHPEEFNAFVTREALDLIKELHEVVRNYYYRFHKIVTPPYSEDVMPISNVIPLRKLEKDAGEACDVKYLGERVNPTTNTKTTCLIRQFRKSSNDSNSTFILRDMYALESRWNSEPVPQHIVKTFLIETEPDNDLFFTCYELPGDAVMLDKLSLQGITLGERLDLLIGIAKGIAEMHGGEDPIVHRYLNPSSIMITKGRNGKRVPKIGNFEYAKLYHPEVETVVSQYMNRVDIYMPPELDLRKDTSWPSVDIYSFGLLVLYMFGINVAAVKNVAQLSKLRLSREFVHIISLAISPIAEDRPAIEAILSMLEKEATAHV